MTVWTPKPQEELAPKMRELTGQVSSPEYGRYLDDFRQGDVFAHPRGYTFDQGEMRAFATTFMQANPLFLNREYALAFGFREVPATPQLVFNVVLSLGVQNDSEKAMANLGYYQARYLRPVYAGDTVCAFTQVVSQRDRGQDQPGIVHIRTSGVNQHNQVVLQYERKIMVRHRPMDPNVHEVPPQTSRITTPSIPQFPWSETAQIDIPVVLSLTATQKFRHLTGNTYGENFHPGDIIIHANGRTITDEHVGWTYRVGNTHPLHYDRLYSQRQAGPMSGEPIVYGGLVFAWLEGLASRDLSENAVWDMGFTEGYHTQPAFSGDTVSAISRVLAVNEVPNVLDGGVVLVTVQLIGVKNISAQQAWTRYGMDLFIKENDRKSINKEKIGDKVFEIERQLLLRKRPNA